MKRIERVGWLAMIVAIVGAVAAFAHAWRSLDSLSRAPTTEDAFYAFAVAKNAALGRGLATGGASTWAATDGVQPLWVIVLTPIFWMFRDDSTAAMRVVSALSSAIFIAVTVLVARRAVDRARRFADVDPRAAGAIAAALVLGSFSMFAHAHDGLETGLHLLTVAIALAAIRANAPVATRALILAVACWARLDAALLAVAHLALGLDARRRTGKMDRNAIVASTLALASIGPWMLRSLRLHGHWMPTSGAAESLHPDLIANLRGAVLAIDRWIVPTLYRPGAATGWTRSLDVAIAIGVLSAIIAAWRSRDRAEPFARFDDADRTLALYVALLAATYVTRFSAPYFMARFLAPTMILTVPVVATWLASRPVRALALLAVTILFDGTWFARSLADDPPERINRNYTEQLHTVRAHLRDECVVGASQSGTLGFFRDRVMNLDGKVDARALDARRRDALPAFVKASSIDAIVEWPFFVDEILGASRQGFHRVVFAGELEYQVWIRDGRERCLVP